jgi:hypothetical protein
VVRRAHDSVFLQIPAVGSQPLSDRHPGHNRVKKASYSVNWNDGVSRDSAWIILRNQMETMLCRLAIQFGAPSDKFIDCRECLRVVAEPKARHIRVAKKDARYHRQGQTAADPLA